MTDDEVEAMFTPGPPCSQLLGWRLLEHDATRGWIKVAFDGRAEFPQPCRPGAGGHSHSDARRRTPSWTVRLGGLRANASTVSHAELDEAEQLDAGDPHELAVRYRELREQLPALRVLGGCCGTDHRHIDAISTACVASRSG